MRSTASSLLLSVVLGTQLASVASKFHYGPKGGNCIPMNPSQGNAVGAAYWMTNEASGNHVFAADIGSDGKLDIRNAFPTGGLGLHGVTAATGSTSDADGLFSQGSVAVSAASNMLAVVNPGSDTVSLFSIDPSEPSNLTLVAEPRGSGGQFPISVAFNKAGDTVCVLNGGEVASVSCFKVNATTGLTPAVGATRMLDLNQTTPANGPPNTASQVHFSQDDQQVMASIKGAPGAPGYLAVWDISSSGSLSTNFTPISPPSGGALPFSLTPISGQDAFLVTDPALGYDIFDFSGSNRSSAFATAGQGATCWSTFSNKTGNYYLIDATGFVYEVSVDSNLNGTLVKTYPYDGTTIDAEVASTGGNEYLYVLAPNITSVEVVALDGPENAQNLQTLDIAGPARAAGVPVGISLQGMATFVKR